MAATIVAGVCEDHQDYDYDLIIPFKCGKNEKQNRTDCTVCLTKTS